MGDIYSIAQEVLLRLGPESEDSNLAMIFLKSISQDLEGEDSGITVKPKTKTKQLKNNKSFRKTRAAKWAASGQLLRRNWFLRQRGVFAIL
jgi:Heterokaryon incompatibility protein (HET)